MKSKQPRRLGIESLETRNLLAGNVLVSVDEGVLVITGDAAANRFQIQQLPGTSSSGGWQGARYTVSQSYIPPNEEPTTLNGETSVIVEGIKNGMQMDLQAGDDLVYIFGVHGVGTRAQVPGVVSVDTGDGGDVLGANMENHNRIEIQLGSGRDELRLAATLHVLSVESDRTFDPNEPPIGSYSDNFDLLKVWLTAGGAVSIDTKYGIDEIILPRLITTSASATVDIQAKTGRIAVDLQTGTLKGPLRIVSGDGNDEIRVRNASVTGNVVVNSGRGHDFIRVENATISNRLSVWCGEGQDSLDIWGGVVADSSVLGGGDDYDVLQVVGDSNDLGELQVSGFEVQRGL